MNTTPGIVCLLLVLSTTGCANLRWHKADAEAAQSERDLDQCHQKAALAARRMASTSGQIPTIVGSPSGPLTMSSHSFGDTTDLAAQQSMLSDCMRARGYRLVPAE